MATRQRTIERKRREFAAGWRTDRNTRLTESSLGRTLDSAQICTREAWRASQPGDIPPSLAGNCHDDDWQLYIMRFVNHMKARNVWMLGSPDDPKQRALVEPAIAYRERITWRGEE